jgi:peptide/nickel transport system ATP-binding protein
VNVLEVRGLTVQYGTGSSALTAVDGVDLTVPEGGTLGLVGESGCGKSTIARALVGLVPSVRGSIVFKGVDCSRGPARNTRWFRRRVQMVFQDPYASLNPRMSVQELMDEALGLREDSHQSPRNRISETRRILDMTGLPTDSLHRFPHQFSGGQRQRIAIARALAIGPELLINDEITSALDVSVQGTLLNLLKDLQRDLGLSYILITHDLSVARAMSDAVAVMYLGRVVEHAPTDDLFGAPTHPYTRALIGSVPNLVDDRKPAPLVGELPDPRHPPGGCRFHTRCAVGPLIRAERTICLEQDPGADAASRLHGCACHFAPPRSAGVPSSAAR